MRFLHAVVATAVALVLVAAPAGAAGEKTYVVRCSGSTTRWRRDRPTSGSRTASWSGAAGASTAVTRGTSENVEPVDVAIEVCDGTAQYVDDHLDEWMAQVGRCCPWGARLSWSQGAMTAQELALARPDLVAGAVMMATRGPAERVRPGSLRDRGRDRDVAGREPAAIRHERRQHVLPFLTSVLA